MHNWAVVHNVAVFSELSFAAHWQGRLNNSDQGIYVI